MELGSSSVHDVCNMVLNNQDIQCKKEIRYTVGYYLASQQPTGPEQSHDVFCLKKKKKKEYACT